MSSVYMRHVSPSLKYNDASTQLCFSPNATQALCTQTCHLRGAPGDPYALPVISNTCGLPSASYVRGRPGGHRTNVRLSGGSMWSMTAMGRTSAYTARTAAVAIVVARGDVGRRYRDRGSAEVHARMHESSVAGVTVCTSNIGSTMVPPRVSRA